MAAITTSKSKTVRSCYEWAQLICGTVAVMTCIYIFLFRMVDVHGSSMEATLSHGERLLLSSLPYTPDYTDIVVIDRGGSQEPLIKRVIGLPGDTIFVDDGKVYRNDVLLEEPYIVVDTAPEQMTNPVVVPEDMVFVMGDNRTVGQSLDSRTFGCVPQQAIVGKTVYRLYPLNRLGGLYRDEY